MAYFYYIKRLGTHYPRLSDRHPREALVPEEVENLVEVPTELLGLTLNQLSRIYPLKGSDK